MCTTIYGIAITIGWADVQAQVTLMSKPTFTIAKITKNLPVTAIRIWGTCQQDGVEKS
jgi:hypothetical protein